MADAVTALLSGFSNPAVTALSLLMDSEVFFAALVLALMLLTEGRNEKRKKILTILAFTLLAASAIKELYAAPRACTRPELIACPSTYSFPSIHSAVAFALMLSFVNKPVYPFYLLFALFVAFSRIYLGVHVFADVAGALVVASVSYYAIDLVYKFPRLSEEAGKEVYK